MGHLTLKIFAGSKEQDIQINSQTNTNLQRSDKSANDIADITIRLCEKACDNKANMALIKLFKKLTKKPVRIVSGTKSRIKVIMFDGDSQAFLDLLRNSLSSL